ncbi:porphobilinogen synthase [Roseospira marina]|uniref:Delta-aminolevulinic acid dehydratase n=1 Tax=Roseospira marina TaxID=140057 RepID=A0A5M6IGA2_9PROT|nr:porphobilinogen synthase [Roseospira marina]KAA5606705.1 porphobilinogen synthase [Roseospira marina]MBB4313882.1 porphobilinogen synthase [Roseospira marina]MBB5087044.1 porphobilinogen synthase [Roseospira marina]
MSGLTVVNGLGRYPRTRPRRLRVAAWSRDLVAETHLSVNDLVWPVFVIEGEGQREPVDSMPGVERLSIDLLVEAVGEAKALGVKAIDLFPRVEPHLKTPDGREATNPDNLVSRATRALKAAHPDVGIFCDVALDPYNSDGHDGIVKDGVILNDETISVLIKQSLVFAAAGCDVISPSDMMDGRVGQIRDALDAAGFGHVQIMAYAAKYASAFYGPFRDAIGTDAALKGDKKTYQMNPANTDEALREVAMDLDEGADSVMVKPGMPYLDIVQRVRETFAVPTLVYQVSGEYAMIKAAVNNGWLDNDRAVLESLLAFKRAGANAIFTYAAVEAARLLRDG